MKDFITKIFKRSKPQKQEKPFESNWKQEQFEKNVKQGVKSLFSGKDVIIHQDSRDFELGLEIKNQYIRERMRELAEKVKVESCSEGIRITLKTNNI